MQRLRNQRTILKQLLQGADRRFIHRVAVQPAGCNPLRLQLQLNLNLAPSKAFLNAQISLEFIWKQPCFTLIFVSQLPDFR